MVTCLLSAQKACFTGTRTRCNFEGAHTTCHPPRFQPTSTSWTPTSTSRVCPSTELAELRKAEPIHWVDIPGGTGGFEDKGYWLVTKHADVKEVSRRSDVFSSWQNGAIPVWPKEMTRENVELQRSVMLNMDAPHHTRLRKIISRGFTPRAIGRLRGGTCAARAEHRQDRRGGGLRRLRRAGSLRAAAAGDRRICSVFRRTTATSCSAGPTR